MTPKAMDKATEEKLANEWFNSPEIQGHIYDANRWLKKRPEILPFSNEAFLGALMAGTRLNFDEGLALLSFEGGAAQIDQWIGGEPAGSRCSGAAFKMRDGKVDFTRDGFARLHAVSVPIYLPRGIWALLLPPSAMINDELVWILNPDDPDADNLVRVEAFLSNLADRLDLDSPRVLNTLPLPVGTGAYVSSYAPWLRYDIEDLERVLIDDTNWRTLSRGQEWNRK